MTKYLLLTLWPEALYHFIMCVNLCNPKNNQDAEIVYNHKAPTVAIISQVLANHLFVFNLYSFLKRAM